MIEWVRAVVVLIALTFFVTFVNCTMIATIVANSRDRENPPNVMQWRKGWDCTCEVWKGYLGLEQD